MSIQQSMSESQRHGGSMTAGSPSPWTLFETYGPIVSRLMARKFPSLSDDVIDELVSETIARVGKKLASTGALAALPDEARFALIYRAAKNAAIDRVKYSPRISPTDPVILDQDALGKSAMSDVAPQSSYTAQERSDLERAVARLSPFDQRILDAAMTRREFWARELAQEITAEETGRPEGEPPAGAAGERDRAAVARLTGKLRVRKLRIIERLRAAMREKGYQVLSSD